MFDYLVSEEEQKEALDNLGSIFGSPEDLLDEDDEDDEYEI